MYSPKIHEELIPQLYRLAKGLHIPMTRLVHALLAQGIERLQQGAVHVDELPVGGSARKKQTKQRSQ